MISIRIFSTCLFITYLCRQRQQGVECCDVSDKSYKDRIDELKKAAIRRVENGFFDRREREAMVSEIFNYVDAVESVYMEIGMKCGAALAVQFLSGNKVK